MSQSSEILKLITANGPSTVGGVYAKAREVWPDLSEERFLSIIDTLEDGGEVELDAPPTPSGSWAAYMRPAGHNAWFYASVAFAVLSIPFSVYLTSFPAIIARWVVVLSMLAFVPGYVTVQALFTRREFSGPERATYSVVLSVVIVSFIGLAFNITPLGLNAFAVTVGVTGYVVLFALLGVVRRRRSAKSPDGHRTHA
ncbi:MAG: DUF1616 domain-containing protein [Nitrososphaerota archaeon]|nr:DUF1616 domain-containing protein [Nitrososphaerota archaeon]